MSSRRVARLAAPVALGAGVIALGMLSGCYERVVGARGLGASTYDIHESYQANSGIDDWLYGKRDTTNGTKVVRQESSGN